MATSSSSSTVSASQKQIRGSDSMKDEESKRLQRVIEILESELDTAVCLRASQSGKMSREMLRRQEADIDAAFREVNYLRAELRELANDSTIPYYRKPLLSKYLAANVKELSSREHYGMLALTSASSDAASGLTNKEWKLRVICDCKVVVEARKIRDKPALNKVIAERKKNEYDYNRAKSILKSDYDALCLTWPADYSGLIKLSKGDSLKKEAKIKDKNVGTEAEPDIPASEPRQSFHPTFF